MKSRIYIEAFNCVTSTGENPEQFWGALDQGRTGIKKTDMTCWPQSIKNFWSVQNHRPISCKIKSGHRDNDSALYRLAFTLSQVAAVTLNDTDLSLATGIIFASTKGAIEDFVWDERIPSVDPLYAVLEETIKELPAFNWTLKQVVSNSCASSHAAIALAQKWMDCGVCQKVLVIAGDIIGPFVHSGFQTLKALSAESARPFQESRDGLVLGEALTAILFSKSPSDFELLDCQIFNEAHTVTGASPEGRGLIECIKRLRVGSVKPDFAIAHGTATFLNDQVEDRALSAAQEFFERNFFITGTKWSVGHTLGASGSVDLIAALMSLSKQKVFSLNAVDEEKNGQDFLAKNYAYVSKSRPLNSALITSLGFGGTNGALMIRRHE